MHDLFVAVALALELDGGVLDAETLPQDGSRVGEDLVVAPARRSLADDDDMAAQRDEPAGDGPHVEVVHGRNAGHLPESIVDLLEIEMRRKRFEEHIHGLAAEANPIVVRIAQTMGIPGITIAKLATVGFAALLMVLIAPRRRKLAYSLLLFGVAAGLVGGLSNVASF